MSTSASSSPAALSLGDRMKAYEAVSRSSLPPHAFTIIRVDGRAFHSYTRGLQRPFDAAFAADMDFTAAQLCREVSGTVLAYVQSDEISLVVADTKSDVTQQWFGGVHAKLCSVSASVATAALNVRRPPATLGAAALFDARAFVLPSRAEVAAYLVWRQRDARKNAVSSAAQSLFSHTQLHGLHTDALIELMASQQVRFDDYPPGFISGRVVTRQTRQEVVEFTHSRTGVVHTTQALRSHWEPEAAPEFTFGPAGWLAEVLPPDYVNLAAEADRAL